MVRQAGFTLLELIVVLAIAALILAVVAPALSRGSDIAALDRTARELLAGLKYTRSYAVAQHEEAVFQIDLKERFYTLPGRDRQHKVSSVLAIDLTTVESERNGDQGGGIRFFPDGSATGGRVSLKVGERIRHVDVEWMGGRVRVLE